MFFLKPYLERVRFLGVFWRSDAKDWVSDHVGRENGFPIFCKLKDLSYSMKIHLVTIYENLVQASSFFKLYKIKSCTLYRVPTTYVQESAAASQQYGWLDINPPFHVRQLKAS